MIAPSVAAPLQLPPRVQDYVEAIVRTCADRERALVSVVLLAAPQRTVTRQRFPTWTLLSFSLTMRPAMTGSGCAMKCYVSKPYTVSATSVSNRGAFMQRVTANIRSFFVCTRGDLLSGSPARILDIPPQQAIFVDRVVIPSIVCSAITVWGEDLLPNVPLPPIRRFDVFKAFHGLAGQVLLTAVVFPVLPGATKYAMGALKRSVHNCFFCYHGRRASLEEEIDFFQRRLGPSRTLTQLLALRGEYRPSLAFVVRCLPTMAWLHLRTAVENTFPREVLRHERTHMSQVPSL